MKEIIEKYYSTSAMKDIDHYHEETSGKGSQIQILAVCIDGAYFSRSIIKITLRDFSFHV